MHDPDGPAVVAEPKARGAHGASLDLADVVAAPDVSPGPVHSAAAARLASATAAGGGRSAAGDGRSAAGDRRSSAGAALPPFPQLRALQRLAGNRALAGLLSPRSAARGSAASTPVPAVSEHDVTSGGAGVQRLTHQPITMQPITMQPITMQPITMQPIAMQRSPITVQRSPENDKALAAIQGFAMLALLPALAALPEPVRTDEESGARVGGPRLVLAQRTVKAKGTPWLEFVAAHDGELAAFPNDQISDVMSFLGAPKDSRYYKADQFDNKFDGTVDAGAGVIMIILRVRFAFQDGLRFGTALPGTPAWEKETKEGKAQFGPDFKKAVEEAWSGKGTVKPGCAVGAIQQFRTELRIDVVEAGEHIVFDVKRGDIGEANVDKDPNAHRGELETGSNQPKTEKDHPVMDDRGRPAGTATNTHRASVHETGHALGLHHVLEKRGNADSAYGLTAGQRQDVMGAGEKIQVITKAGKIIHDDFAPFERVGERWGKDYFTGSLAKCNVWTATQG